MTVYMSTILSRRTSDILAHVSRLRSTLSRKSLLYTISVSQQTSAAELSKLVSAVKSLSSESVGCLSASIPSFCSSWQQYTAVSLAAFDKTHATLFRSTVPGRKAAQVGRWHAIHQKELHQDTRDYSQHIDWESALSNPHDGGSLPSALQTLPAEAVDSVVYFSDNAPEGLGSALSKFGSATKLGLIATSTPFVTGRPYTMFHNDAVYSDGAVGVCLSSPARSNSWSTFPGLEALTRPMLVTSTEGNLVNSLDNANPSRLLLHAIQNHPSAASHANQAVSKTLRLYLGTLKQRGGAHELCQLYNILSGDPSRGSIALDTDSAPSEGTLVQMFLLPSAKQDVLHQVSQRQANARQMRSLTFASIDSDDLSASPPPHEDDPDGDHAIVIPDVFLAASENGMFVGRGEMGVAGERPWRCVVPGSLMSIGWKSWNS